MTDELKINGPHTYKCKNGHVFENCFGAPMTIWETDLCSGCWGEWMKAQGWQVYKCDNKTDPVPEDDG